MKRWWKGRRGQPPTAPPDEELAIGARAVAGAFHSAVAQRIHGSFRVGEGVAVHVGEGISGADRAAAQMHEWIHYELTDNTTFGWFQTLLFTIPGWTGVPPSVRHRAREAFQLATDACSQVHEGLATYRALTWYQAHDGPTAAKRHYADVPEHYRAALELVSAVLGDPIAEDRGPELAATIHLGCLCLGYAALNVPLLEHYPGPRSLLDASLPYITHKSPDERFRALVQVPGMRQLMARQLQDIERALDRERPPARPDLIFAVTDRVLTAIAEHVPLLRLLTFTERTAVLRQLSASWRLALNSEYGLEAVAGPSGVKDLAVTLEPRFVRDRRNPSSSTAVDQAVEVQVNPEEHRALVAGSASEWIAFSFLSELPPGDSFGAHELETTRAGAATFWLSTDGAPDAAPRVRDICLILEASLADFVRHSADLAGAAHVWYANPNLLRALREHGTPLRSFTIEHRESPGLVLAAARSADESPAGWLDVDLGSYSGVTMVVYRWGIDFSLRSPPQATLFESMADPAWPRLNDTDEIAVGDRRLTLERMARFASWGNLLS
jgi:hypothetical protein